MAYLAMICKLTNPLGSLFISSFMNVSVEDQSVKAGVVLLARKSE
jgi:hypothetical protein